MIIPHLLVLFAVGWFSNTPATIGGEQQAAEPPKLVVMVVIDQFPAYLLPRLRTHFAPRGLRLLLEQGAWY